MRIITPAPRDTWLELIECDRNAFVYQTPVGLDAICAELGCEDASRLYEFEDGQQIVLPLYRPMHGLKRLTVERSPLVGSVVSRAPLRAEELRAIFADLEGRQLLRTILRPSAVDADIWESAIPKTVTRVSCLAHVLDLSGGFETVWKTRFNDQARRAVKKAEKAGVKVERNVGGALIDEFYELYCRSVERWAIARGEPLALARLRARRRMRLDQFRRKVAMLGDTCRIWVARVDGRSAAAIVVLQGHNAHYTLGAMDQDVAGPTRASFLLQKLAIEEACSAGCRYYNMGETGVSESLARFKSHFGATRYAYSEFRIERLPITAIALRAKSLLKRAVSVRAWRREAPA